MTRAQVVEQLPGLRRYARAPTGNGWAADDLVQDALERACSKWRLWTVGSDLRAWLFTVMHNLYASDMRRTLRRQQVGAPVVVDMLAHELAAPDVATALGVDLVLESGAPSAEHDKNILNRLKEPPMPEAINSPLQISEEPIADTGRYDRLRDEVSDHA